MNVEGMKVAELKEELKRRGLPTHGLKAALAERLTAAVDAENDESAAPTGLNGGDDELSAGDDAPATTPAPMSEAPQSEDDDVDFLEDAPSGPASGAPEPTPVPTVVTDAAPTASLEEEPEEEPDYEPEETPTPPPKRPREDPVADDDDAKRPKVTEEPADGAMAPGVENNNNNDNNNNDDDVSPPTRALRIDNFVRPFTFNQVRTMLAQFGAFDVDGVDTPVWMNQPVKTHAIVVYADDSSANECKAFLDQRRWPEETGRALRVRYVSLTEAAETVRAAESAKREAEERVAKARLERGNQQRGRAGTVQPQHSHQQREGSDDAMRWTRTWPRISWRERRRG